jgi:hypothetical protein
MSMIILGTTVPPPTLIIRAGTAIGFKLLFGRFARIRG